VLNNSKGLLVQKSVKKKLKSYLTRPGELKFSDKFIYVQ
jgi:hypothetical protein